MNGPRVAIVGGGLAGLAAAVALGEHGCHVELLEARRQLGGRAGSYTDRESGELVDHCQHVALGCCTNYLDFCRRTGIADLLEPFDTLHFLGPDGRRSDLAPAGWLPAPLSLLPSFLRLRHLSWGDKWRIARALRALARLPAEDLPDGPTMEDWLRRAGQTPAALERFWQVILVSALGESLDRASLAAARKVFLDGFLAHRDAGRLYVPRVPLGELYDGRVAAWLARRGARLEVQTPVREVLSNGERATGLLLASGETRPVEQVLLAVPWRRAAALIPAAWRGAVNPGGAWETISAAPITGLHLWLDRPLTDLPHAVLVGRLSQWVFARTRPEAGPAESAGRREHYYQVVISASRSLAGRERGEIVDEALADLRAVFPAARPARLLRAKIVTDPEAVFSVRPGLDRVRPPQTTPLPNLFLAGDWTQTGWPATMEGAVRSGYLAAEALLARLNRPARLIVPDLPRSPLSRWLLGTT